MALKTLKIIPQRSLFNEKFLCFTSYFSNLSGEVKTAALSRKYLAEKME